MTTCGMRASTNQGKDKRKESRMHTESKKQGNNNASHRGQTNTASRRGQKDIVSPRDGTTMLLTEDNQTLPLAEARRISSLPETGQHCLSQRREGALSLAETEQHCLSQRLEGKQGETKLLFPHHGTRDTFESILIWWTLITDNGDAFQLTRNSLDTFHPRDKRCHVCRDFTAARCDHRATDYT